MAASVAQAAPLTGPLFAKYRELAKQYGMWCAYGGFHEKVDGGSANVDVDGGGARKIGNTHVLVSPVGVVTAEYRKAHLFDVDIAGQFS